MIYQPKNLLITGGAGFIGCNFIRDYLTQHKPQQLVNLDCLSYAGNQRNCEDFADDPRYRFVQGNITDLNLIQSLLRDYNIDTIVHFAAESHVDRSINTPELFITSNIIGTYTLLEAAKQIWLNAQHWDRTQCRFHHISTDEVYGSLQLSDPAFSELTPYAPRSPYAASKAGSDHWVQAYHHTYGLPITLSNCSNNYGPYQHQEKLIPTIITACQQQRPIPVYGDGSNIRDWLYVSDHCSAITAILHHGMVGESYNVGGDNEQNNLAIVNLICQLMDERFPQQAPHARLIEFVTDRPGHDWRYAIDASKLATTLNWRPTTAFKAGLQQTLDYYLEQP